MKKEVAITKILQNGRVDGVLISISEQTSDAMHLQELEEKEIPLVFFDRVVEHMDSPKVTTDDYNSGANATEHLIENGCKRIAFLSISQSLSISNKRMNGYRSALTKHNLPIDDSLVINFTGNDLTDKELIRQLLKSPARPDGIFASVEKLAIETYEICEELQLKIPADVKVICFSNLKTAGLLNPSMTTITQPAYEIGREAAAILFKLVEMKGHHFLLEKTVINSKLVERNSTRTTDS
jgi:LacI family transcriptional regulator